MKTQEQIEAKLRELEEGLTLLQQESQKKGGIAVIQGVNKRVKGASKLKAEIAVLKWVLEDV